MSIINLFEQPTQQIIIPNARKSTWENLGKKVNALTVEEALNQGGLNYTVHQEPVFLENGIQVPNKFCNIRDDGVIYDIVSDRYTIIQNNEAFSFIDCMGDVDLKLEKVGETQGGMIYIIGKLPAIDILGDTYQPHVIFRNSHNGKYQLQATIAPLRVVCQNQFNLAFKESPNTITIRHTATYGNKLANANEVIVGSSKYLETLKEQAEKFAQMKLSDSQVMEVIDSLFMIKDDMKNFQKERIENSRVQMIKAYRADDNQNFKNSIWGMINAYSDYITHKQPTRNTSTAAENQFLAVTFDPKLLQRMVDMCLVKVA